MLVVGKDPSGWEPDQLARGGAKQDGRGWIGVGDLTGGFDEQDTFDKGGRQGHPREPSFCEVELSFCSRLQRTRVCGGAELPSPSREGDREAVEDPDRRAASVQGDGVSMTEDLTLDEPGDGDTDHASNGRKSGVNCCLPTL